jgi:hypothetical protein
VQRRGVTEPFWFHPGSQGSEGGGGWAELMAEMADPRRVSGRN